jgi:hypothetical protein
MLMDRTSAVKKELYGVSYENSTEAAGNFHILVMRHQWRSKAPPSGIPGGEKGHRRNESLENIFTIRRVYDVVFVPCVRVNKIPHYMEG